MERYNPWWTDEPDILFEQWKASKVHWVPEFVDAVTLRPFSMHFLSGPRQVGKTTAIRILIQKLIKERPPKSVFYYSCDELTDFRELGEVLDNYLRSRKPWGVKGSVILLDEVTFVDEWWRAVKARIDAGEFTKDVLVVTGSARLDLLKQKETFPGRRGAGRDYAMHPLAFSAFARVVGGLETKQGGLAMLKRNSSANKLFSEKLSALFKTYLEVGGFPRGIQDHSRYGKVTPETSRTYLDWLRGDWSRAGRSDGFMKEILSYLIRAQGTPISWNSVSAQTSVNSPNTVRAYVETLEGMQAALVLNLIRPDSRIEHRKNKKVHFTDPFIIHVLENYAGVEAAESWLWEATVAAHLSRWYPIYYWRNHTEVDVVCAHGGQQIGFEVSRGLKRWKPPWHIKESYLLDKVSLPLYLSALRS
jgi:hypothetical protein